MMSTAAPRLPDADARLQALVASRLRRPFKWGAHDCALFVADCAAACTGHDPAPDLRGRYASERGAARVLRAELGARPAAELLAGIVAARLGPEILPAMAAPGDAGLAEQGGRAILAVCVGSQWLAPGPEGLEPVNAPARAWSAACPR